MMKEIVRCTDESKSGFLKEVCAVSYTYICLYMQLLVGVYKDVINGIQCAYLKLN